jgi:hypothetical protein
MSNANQVLPYLSISPSVIFFLELLLPMRVTSVIITILGILSILPRLPKLRSSRQRSHILEDNCQRNQGHNDRKKTRNAQTRSQWQADDDYSRNGPHDNASVLSKIQFAAAMMGALESDLGKDQGPRSILRPVQ